MQVIKMQVHMLQIKQDKLQWHLSRSLSVEKQKARIWSGCWSQSNFYLQAWYSCEKEMKSNYNRTETFSKSSKKLIPLYSLGQFSLFQNAHTTVVTHGQWKWTQWNKHRKTLEDIQRMKQLLHDRRLKNVTCLVQPRKAKKWLDHCLLLSKKD